MDGDDGWGGEDALAAGEVESLRSEEDQDLRRAPALQLALDSDSGEEGMPSDEGEGGGPFLDRSSSEEGEERERRQLPRAPQIGRRRAHEHRAHHRHPERARERPRAGRQHRQNQEARDPVSRLEELVKLGAVTEDLRRKATLLSERMRHMVSAPPSSVSVVGVACMGAWA